MSLRTPVFVLVTLCGIAGYLPAQPAHPGGGAPSLPRGMHLGLHLGLLLPDDRSGIGIDGGGTGRIDAYIRSVPERFETISAQLGGPFFLNGEPGGYSIDPALTFGLSAGYEFRPGWEGRLVIGSYRAEVSARLPLLVETESGPRAALGLVVTDVRGILADASLSRQWQIGAYLPQIGLGVQYHRLAPEDTRVEIERIGFFVDRTDARNDLSPMIEIGLARAISEMIRVGLTGVIAGRSLPDAGGPESWVVEPEIRLQGSFQLDSKQTAPPPPPEHPPDEPPPPKEPPDSPPPEKDRRCSLTQDIEPHTPILAELLHPDTSDGYPRAVLSYIPLVAHANDLDRIRQTCICREDGSSAERKTEITDRLIYTWTQESGEGSLIHQGGPAALYMPPELEVAAFDTASFVCKIADARGNDDSIICRVRTTVRRTAPCAYTQSAEIADPFPVYSFLETIPRAEGSCLPSAPAWDPKPDFTVSHSIPDEVCAGELRLFRAESQDGDQDMLRLACAGPCGDDDLELILTDEHLYTWTAARGAFAGPDGRYWETVTTNGRKSSVVYLSPEEAGQDTITVEFRDSGKQGIDPPKIRKKGIGVIEVDIDIVDDGIYYAGVADPFELCDGGTAARNTDDDNENGKPDLGERTVKDEDDLLEVLLEVRGTKSGTVTLDTFQPLKGRVRVWESSGKRKEIKTPRSYPVSSLPKTVWVEGTEISGLMRDVTLTLRRSEGCGDEAAVTVVPWCADAAEDCAWMIHTLSWDDEDRSWTEIGKHLADGQSAMIADCEAKDPAAFGACMRKFFDKHPDCCCIMKLIVIGHGPDCAKDKDHCGKCSSATPSGLGGGADSWKDDAYKLWEHMLCDEATIEYRKCNGYYESFFWEFAARLGAGREVQAYTETVTPLTPGLSDSKKFEVPKDAGPGDGDALKELADCITDPARTEEEKEACRTAWAERHKK